MDENTVEKIIGPVLFVFVTTVVLVILVGLFWAYPQYRVWQKELSGKATLREAEWSRKVAVEEAKAKEESSTLEANAEVERAKGVAEANRIIGDGLRDNEAYLRYLFIDGFKNTANQVIYVPTEAGLPILEAQRKPVTNQ